MGDEEMERVRLERENVINNIEIDRKKHVEIIEVERKTQLDQQNEMWRISCTDNCNVCRESHEILREKIHQGGEDKLRTIRVRYEETIRKEQIVTKEAMEIVSVKRKTEIDRIIAKKSGCPHVAAQEKQTCRHKLEIQIHQVREQLKINVEQIKENEVKLGEQTRIQFEEKLKVVMMNEAAKKKALYTQHTSNLDVLRTQKLKCEAQGQQKVMTCTEKIDHQLDIVKTERDEALSIVQINTDNEIDREDKIRHDQLIKVSVQLEEQLTNIREQYYELIERINRKCMGGRKDACPELDCNVCFGA